MKQLKLFFTIFLSVFFLVITSLPRKKFSNKVYAACPGNSSCSSDGCGVESLQYTGTFDDGSSTLTCTYDPDYCQSPDAATTVPCPDSADCPAACEPCGCTPDPTDPYDTCSCPDCDANDPDAGCNLPGAWDGVCFEGGVNDGCIDDQHCITSNDGGACFINNVDVYCSAGCAAGPTPTSGPGPTSPPGVTPTPTPGPRTFQGNFYEDADATTTGIGGTDNLCTGLTTAPIVPAIYMPGSEVSATRTGGESQSVLADTAYYSITTNTSNSDYTVALQLPFPPPDPDNAWQCACNADPGDPYRCLYTNQTPSDFAVANFFLKQANIADAAWFQTLGGSSWAANNIESLIPTSTCTPPSCSPALISSDPAGNSDSAGFPLTESGSVSTSISGDNYIHEATDRTPAVQAQATGVSVPTENYDYFFDKVGDQAETLATAAKPIVGTELGIYQHTGNLVIDENNPWNLTNTERIIVFVDGDITIDDTVAGENRITTVATGGNAYLMFISSGDITVTADVGYSNIATDPTTADISNLEGVFIADGTLTIAGTDSTTDRKFIGAGTFVGWSGIALGRNFDDGASPTLNDDEATETFIFRPDFLVNTPKAIKSAQMTWREVEPSF